MWHILVIFGWVGWWMSGDMRELRHLCGHLQPDFGEWMGVAPSMLLKMTYFLLSSTLAICHFAWPRKTGPTKSPKKAFFPEFPKRNLTLGGGRFPGRTQVENWRGTALVSPHFFLNIKLPFWDIDGATPTHSPKSCCKCPHRWRNSLIPPDIHQPT